MEALAAGLTALGSAVVGIAWAAAVLGIVTVGCLTYLIDREEITVEEASQKQADEVSLHTEEDFVDLDIDKILTTEQGKRCLNCGEINGFDEKACTVCGKKL